MAGRAGRQSWRLFLLDDFRLERDGEVVAQFFERRQDALLAALALSPGQSVRRSELARMLWPDRSMSLARNRLNEVLFLLTRSFDGLGLPRNLLKPSRQGITLSSSVRTDVADFEQLVVRGLSTNSAAERRECLHAAVAMYGHGPLPLLSDDWLESIRTRLSRMHDAAEEALASLPDHIVESDQDVMPIALTNLPVRSAEVPVPRSAAEAQPIAQRRRAGRPRGRGRAIQPDANVRQLVAADAATFRRGEAAHWAEVVDQCEPHLLGADRAEWIKFLDENYEKIRRSLDWAVETGATEIAVGIAGGLAAYHEDTGRTDLGRRLIIQALASGEEQAAREFARAWHGLGTLSLASGEIERGVTYLSQAVDLWEELGDQRALARTQNGLALASFKAGNFSEARRLHKAALANADAADATQVRLAVLKDAAMTEMADEEFDQAKALLREAIELARNVADLHAEGAAMAELGTIAQYEEDWASSIGLIHAALDKMAAAEDRKGVAFGFRSLGYAYGEMGNHAAAEAYLVASQYMSRLAQDMWGTADAIRVQAQLAADKGDFDQARRLFGAALPLLEDIGDEVTASHIRQDLQGLATS